MRTYEQQLNYERLELISHPQPNLKQVPAVLSLFQAIGRKLAEFFSVNSEPQIWQATEPSGEIWWHAYDPITGRSALLASEEEVLEWVEDRYYLNR